MIKQQLMVISYGDKHIQLHTHMYANAYAHMGTQACECIFMNSYMHIYT